ncbi:hypothetical protein [Massilia sp. YIM B04103]|uniref:hypothetical protein n=1 Tax=Massilia sp. YIM B04103 TaxID=2963106 RepID=UPI00210A8C9A|nr:hypothetical protein [Massilia sp. YIM B04103]
MKISKIIFVIFLGFVLGLLISHEQNTTIMALTGISGSAFLLTIYLILLFIYEVYVKFNLANTSYYKNLETQAYEVSTSSLGFDHEGNLRIESLNMND